MKIAGTGSMEDELKAYVKQKKIIDIEFVGFKQGQELEDLTKKAKAIVYSIRVVRELSLFPD